MFEFVLEQTRARHQARVYAYVLMPEHIHLLINEPPLILVAQFLKALKQITSRKLRGDRRQFWQDRYFDANTYGETARSEVIRYIHRNPVKRGLVASPEQYRWSSFNHYITGIRESSKSSRSGRQECAAHPTNKCANGAQTLIFAKCRPVAGSVSGLPAGGCLSVLGVFVGLQSGYHGFHVPFLAALVRLGL